MANMILHCSTLLKHIFKVLVLQCILQYIICHEMSQILVTRYLLVQNVLYLSREPPKTNDCLFFRMSSFIQRGDPLVCSILNVSFKATVVLDTTASQNTIHDTLYLFIVSTMLHCIHDATLYSWWYIVFTMIHCIHDATLYSRWYIVSIQYEDTLVKFFHTNMLQSWSRVWCTQFKVFLNL